MKNSSCLVNTVLCQPSILTELAKTKNAVSNTIMTVSVISCIGPLVKACDLVFYRTFLLATFPLVTKTSCSRELISLE